MPTTKRISAGSLATLLGVDIKTVHGWTDAGLLTQPEHTLGGHRRYDPAAVAKDYTRAGKALPERFALYLDGKVQLETTGQRAISRASTEDLRAELARREERGAA
jgi:phage terminase Nu1 subunit (DNA packaging protein)